MSLFDTILSALPQEHADAGQGGLGGAFQQLIQKDSGGVGGLVNQFRSAGLGHLVDSWIGNGPNQPIAPQQVHRALGDEQVDRMADRTGMSKGELLPLIAQFLPTVIDRLTPQGKIPQRNEEMAEEPSEESPGRTISV